MVSLSLFLRSNVAFVLVFFLLEHDLHDYWQADGFPVRCSAVATRHRPETLLGCVRFVSPLLEEGYRPAVESRSSTALKPLLLYLPGFDGTLLAPFLQFPELGTVFDVRGMTVGYENRQSFAELREVVVDHIKTELNDGRPLYLVGESFGGLLASASVLALQQESSGDFHNIVRGLVLVNPATSYRRSELRKRAGPLAQNAPPWRYPLDLVTQLVPLFLDDHGLPQLLSMLKSETLPSIVDTPAREAYLGRFALTLASRLQFMPQRTLQWRLTDWLAQGCQVLSSSSSSTTTDYDNDCDLLQHLSPKLRTLVVVGEDDRTLPSVEEAARLQGKIVPNATTFVVHGAGHASTCGSRVDLTALLRDRFPELRTEGGRVSMKETASSNTGALFGMEPRYDGRSDVGMLPTRYWDADLYKKVPDDTLGR